MNIPPTESDDDIENDGEKHVYTENEKVKLFSCFLISSFLNSRNTDSLNHSDDNSPRMHEKPKTII